MSDLTQILNAIEAGDRDAADRLLPVVYAELRQLAALQLARERPGQTLDATALVHEAYPAARPRRAERRLEESQALLRRGRRSDAAHPHRKRPPQAHRQAWRRAPPR
jgi:hypothetical protein